MKSRLLSLRTLSSFAVACIFLVIVGSNQCVGQVEIRAIILPQLHVQQWDVKPALPLPFSGEGEPSWTWQLNSAAQFSFSNQFYLYAGGGTATTLLDTKHRTSLEDAMGFLDLSANLQMAEDSFFLHKIDYQLQHINLFGQLGIPLSSTDLKVRWMGVLGAQWSRVVWFETNPSYRVNTFNARFYYQYQRRERSSVDEHISQYIADHLQKNQTAIQLGIRWKGEKGGYDFLITRTFSTSFESFFKPIGWGVQSGFYFVFN